ncbi:MAG: hypothetical protein AAB834_01520, partial [Patescibacteria group bacterium]
IREMPAPPDGQARLDLQEFAQPIVTANHSDFLGYADIRGFPRPVAGRAWNTLVSAFITKDNKHSSGHASYKALPIKFNKVPVVDPSSGRTTGSYGGLDVKRLQSLVEMIDEAIEKRGGDTQAALSHLMPGNQVGPRILDVWRGFAAEALRNRS